MLEPKGDRKSCSQIKTVAPNKISDQNSCLPPPCKSPTHHHHPFAHSSCLPLSCESPPPAPPLQSPASHRTQLHIPTPLATSCRSSTGGGICDEVSSCPLISSPRCKMPHPRYKFLPHLLMPSVPPLIANPHHHPFCKFPPAPPNSPPCQSPRVEILLPLPCPLFCKSLPPPTPFFPNMRP